MNRKITFVSIAISVIISSGFSVRRSFAQARLTIFEDVDAYFRTKEELGISGAALVIVEGDQIVRLKAFVEERRRWLRPSCPRASG